VRLAVLGACEAARRDQVNAWTGVAPALTRAGIPAVIGMQYAIRDASAVGFSRRLYRALAAGQPIDAAVTDGRLAIYNRGDEDERDWGVPVLYLRAEEGVLFPQPGSVFQAGGAVSGPPPTEPQGAVTRPSPTGRRGGPPPPRDVSTRDLRNAIVQNFTLNDLATLCQDIEEALAEDGYGYIRVGLDWLDSTGIEGKARELIIYLRNRGKLDYLVEAVRQARPGVI
jgi:hypothetical protein